MTEQLNIAVIGAGYWARKVIPEYQDITKQIEQVKLVGVFDLNEENLSYCKNRLNVEPIKQTLDEIMKDPSINALHICTPDFTHYKFCKQALNSGKNVFVEPPLALNTQEAIELFRLANEKNLVLHVGSIYRFNAAVKKIKELIESWWFGDIYWIKLHWAAMFPQITKSISVIDSLAHNPVDILDFLCGDFPSEINCISKAHRKGNFAETAYIVCEYRNSMTAHIELSWLNPEKKRELQIMGSKRFAKVDVLEQRVTISDHEYAGSCTDLVFEINNTLRDQQSYFINNILKKMSSIHSIEPIDPFGARNVLFTEIAKDSLLAGRSELVAPIQRFDLASIERIILPSSSSLEKDLKLEKSGDKYPKNLGSQEVEGTKFTFEFGKTCPFKGIECVSTKLKMKYLKGFLGKRNSFIALPSDTSFKQRRLAIKNALKNKGYNPLIADEIYMPTDIICKICLLMEVSELIIVDISLPKGNVFLEAGYAMADQKMTLFIKDRTIPIISGISS